MADLDIIDISGQTCWHSDGYAEHARVSNDMDYYNMLKTFLISLISTNLHLTVPKELFKTIKSYSDFPVR